MFPQVPTWSPKSSKICKKCPPKLVPKAYCQKTPLYKHSNYENMTPVQAGALFSLWHPTSKKSQNRSKMDTKTDQKSPKPCPGRHFQITLRTAHPPPVRKSAKLTSKRVPKMRPNPLKNVKKVTPTPEAVPCGPDPAPCGPDPVPSGPDPVPNGWVRAPWRAQCRSESLQADITRAISASS